MWTFARHRTLAAEDYYSNEICLLDKTTAQQVKHTREIKKLHAETLLWKIYSLCAISKAKLSPVAMWKLFSPAEAFIMFFSLLLWLSALLSLRYHLLLFSDIKTKKLFPSTVAKQVGCDIVMDSCWWNCILLRWIDFICTQANASP